MQNLSRTKVSTFLSKQIVLKKIRRCKISDTCKVTKPVVTNALGKGCVSNKAFIKISSAIGFDMEIIEDKTGKRFNLKPTIK